MSSPIRFADILQAFLEGKTPVEAAVPSQAAEKSAFLDWEWSLQPPLETPLKRDSVHARPNPYQAFSMEKTGPERPAPPAPTLAKSEPSEPPSRPLHWDHLPERERQAWEILNGEGAGLATSFTKQDLKRAFRRLAKRHHPDTLIQASERERKAASRQFDTCRRQYSLLLAAFRESAQRA